MKGRVYLFFVVLVLSFIAGLESKECPKRCDCPDTYKPVCGSSKRTHGNACLAECFGDKVIHEGECKKKCSTFSGIRRGHGCSWVKVGKFTTRKQCCLWKEVCHVGKCRKSGKKCQFVGASRTIQPESSCSWIKNLKSERRRCCYWVKKCVGDKCIRTQEHCDFVGKILRDENDCKWEILKGGSKQQTCCKIVKGKRECHKGPVIHNSIENNCNWKSVSNGCQRRQCCQYKKRCVDNKCETKLLRCTFRSEVVCTKPHKKCIYKRTGPTCSRLLCCTSFKRCVGKKCTQINPKCEFKGDERCTSKHQRCVFKKRSNTVSQLRCCVATRQCVGKSCTTFGRKCSWKGKRIVTTITNGCSWKITGKDSRRKMCCQKVRTCRGKNCKTVKRDCAFKGETIRENQLMKCQWSKYGTYGKRKRCCSSFQRCIGKSCKVLNKKCAYVGEVISKRKKSSCNLLKVKGGKRNQCCSWIRQCYGNTCTNIQKTCNWNGAVIKSSRKCSCKWTQRRDKKQRRCCCVSLQCQNKKCKVMRKNCKWVGYAISTRIKTGCSWKPYGKTGKRKQCCKVSIQCQDKKCKKTVISCNWFGPVVRQYIKQSCRQTKVGKNEFRKKCCKFLTHCVGKECKVTKLDCQFVGEIIKITREKTCSFVKQANGKRKQCCSFTTYCKGNKCEKKDMKCRKVGPLLRTFRKCGCVLTKKSPNTQQNKCCCKTINCVGIECKTKSNQCQWQGDIITTVWIHNCRIEKYGQGTRKRCCSSLRRCQSNFCRNSKNRCVWKGPVTTVSFSKKCYTKQVSQEEKRNICCNYQKTCVGTHCEKKKQNCTIVRSVITRKKHRCLLVSSKRGICQRTRCCNWVEKCVNAKCSETEKQCSWRGKASCSLNNCACQWKQKNDKCQRRQCCCKKRTCYGKQCITKNAKCFWAGSKICSNSLSQEDNNVLSVETQSSNCDWKTVGRTGRQLYCCSKQKECKFVGQLHTSESKRVCEYLEIGKNQARKHCCIVTTNCVGKQCTQKKSRCQFTGPVARNGCLWQKKKVCQKAHLHADFKCQMKTDPSFVTFNGKTINNQQTGKVLIVKKGTFSVKADRSKWTKSTAVTTRFFIAKGKKPVRTLISTVNPGRFVVNGKHISLGVNREFQSHTLMIKRVSYNTAVIQTKKGSFVKITFNNRRNIEGRRKWFQSQFLTATVGIRTLGKSKGLCVDGQNGTLKVKLTKDTNYSTCQIILARKICKERRVPLRGLALCQKRVLAMNPPCPDKKKCKKEECKKCKGDCPKGKCVGQPCSKCKGPGCTPSVPKCKGNKCPKLTCGKDQKLVRGICVSTKCGPNQIFDGEKCVKKPSYFCSANGDPHFTTYNGQHFNNYKVGDFVLTESKNFKVHTRQIKWGGAAVNTRFVVQTNPKGGKVQVNSRDEIIIDGNVVPLKVGETKLISNGGSIRRNSISNFKVEGVDGSYVDVNINNAPAKGVWPQDHYIDMLVFSPTLKGVHGFCVSSNEEIEAKGLFENPHPAIEITPKHCTIAERERARLSCAAALVSKVHMEECIKDVCSSKGALNPKLFHEFEKKSKKAVKKQNDKIQKQIQVNKIRKIKKVVKGHFCNANGDPHFTTFSGNHFNNYKVGDFVLVKGPQFEVHTRQRKWGGAAVNVQFIVRANKDGDLVQVLSRDDVTINGKQTSIQVGNKVELPNGGEVYRYSVSGYKITGIDGSYVDANINVEPSKNAWPEPHYIDLAVFVPSQEGLSGFCVSPVEQIAVGLFKDFQEPKRLEKPKISREERKIAVQLCRSKGVQLNHLGQCATDVVRSGNKFNPSSFAKFERRLLKNQKRFINVMKRHIFRR